MMTRLLMGALLGASLLLCVNTASVPWVFQHRHEQSKRATPGMDLCDNYCVFLDTLGQCQAENIHSGGPGPLANQDIDAVMEQFAEICSASDAIISCVQARSSDCATAGVRVKWVTDARDRFCHGGKINNKFKKWAETKLSAFLSESQECVRASDLSVAGCLAGTGSNFPTRVCMARNEKEGAQRAQKMIANVFVCVVEAFLSSPDCDKKDVELLFALTEYVKVPGSY